ncbi:hypothetical protein ABIB37_002613 [Agrococcus sp. UYP10]|uniref:hypothetical protein n=1 Tax=Agrococcus sp. UYP10 TaxID=1756355 RepID=UPI003397A2D6
MSEDRNPEDELLEQQIAEQWKQITAQQEQITAQQQQMAKSNADLVELLKASIQYPAGAQALPDGVTQHLKRIEENLGGLVFRRPDLDDDQWLKLASVLVPMAGADLRSAMRIEPWTYVPATDRAAMTMEAWLLAERAALIEGVQEQKERERLGRPVGN